MPAYNRANMIKRSIDSVLKQSFSDLELIVVDDGSKDNTFDVVKSIDDKRIRTFPKENGGSASARNFGIKKAKGEYIAFLDSDDLWQRDHLKDLLEYLEQHPKVGMVYSTLLMVNDAGQEQGTYGEDFDRQKIEYSCFMMPSATVLRKSCLKKAGLFDENPAIRQVHEDWEFYLRFSDYYPIEHLNKITGIGLKHLGGQFLASLQNRNYFTGAWYVWQKRFKLFEKERKGGKLAPFDGYYFAIFSNLYTMGGVGEYVKVFKRTDILRENAIPIFEKLIKKDPKNLEVWLPLALLYFMDKKADKVVEVARKAKDLLDQKIKIKDQGLVKFAVSALKGIAFELNNAGEKELAGKFLAKTKEFPQA